jgi:peptidoglycan/LPS O-acetylase OafA/YrhL
MQPLRAGHESVILFFVLSGFVLALPYVNEKQQSYSVFVRRRILRIYGPYLFALGLAVAGCALWTGQSYLWQNVSHVWSAPVQVKSVAAHVLFLGSYTSEYNLAFWSLVYEMRISIIFPLLYFALKKGQIATFLTMAICFAIGFQPGGSLLGRWIGINYLLTFEYAGIFAFGILLAMSNQSLRVWFRDTSVYSKYALALVSFLLFEEGHVFMRTASDESVFGDIPEALGAVGLIAITLHSARISKLMTTAVPKFLGRISYSLYLVHCTVLFGLVAVFHRRVSDLLEFVTYLPLSILLGWLFCRWVEEPFMRLSHKVGKKPAKLATA